MLFKLEKTTSEGAFLKKCFIERLLIDFKNKTTWFRLKMQSKTFYFIFQAFRFQNVKSKMEAIEKSVIVILL